MVDGHQSGQTPVLVIVGPSGSGKTTLNNKLISDFPNTFENSISCTSRPCRPGEKDGVNYKFVSNEEFDRMRANGEFVESAVYVGFQYGTLRSELDRILNLKKVPVLEIDMEGYKQLLEARLPLKGVFVLPPDPGMLRKRLVSRGHDSFDSIEMRVERSKDEIRDSNSYPFDYRLTNDDLEHAYNRLVAVLRGWYPFMPQRLT